MSKSVIQVEDKENKRENSNRNGALNTSTASTLLKRSKTTDSSRLPLK